MIHIIKNIYTIPNNLGFTAIKDKGISEKTGKRRSETLGYCSDISEVCWLAYRTAASDKIAQLENGELADAIRIMKETKETIYKVLGELT